MPISSATSWSLSTRNPTSSSCRFAKVCMCARWWLYAGLFVFPSRAWFRTNRNTDLPVRQAAAQPLMILTQFSCEVGVFCDANRFALRPAILWTTQKVRVGKCFLFHLFYPILYYRKRGTCTTECVCEREPFSSGQSRKACSMVCQQPGQP